MRQKRFLAFASFALLLFLTVISGGCGGGGTSSDENVSSSQVSVIGIPTGELAGAILEAQTTDALVGLGKGDIVILAGMAEVEEYADELKAAYERGCAVAVENAEPDEVEAMLKVLGIEAGDEEAIPNTTSTIYAVARRSNGDEQAEIFNILEDLLNETGVISLEDENVEYVSSKEIESILFDELFTWVARGEDEALSNEDVRSSRYPWRWGYKWVWAYPQYRNRKTGRIVTDWAHPYRMQIRYKVYY
ncbi:MAG: hypothetical protein IJG39_10075 [Synergistaceae bacterium]|nr:hypothetical protein [Synergistaceae bacterium]